MQNEEIQKPMVSLSSQDGQLAHTLERRHIIMISIGGIIGAGLFVGASASIRQTGPAVLLSYIITGFLIFFVMRMLGELVIEKPEAGSFLNHIRRGLGDHVTFVLGWGYWLFWISAIAAEAIAGGIILQPYLHLPHHYDFLSTMVLGPLLVIIMMMSNLFSVRGYGEFEFWFALLKIIAITIFIIIGGIAISHLFGYYTAKINNIWEYDRFFPKGILAIFTIIPTILFTVTGSEIATIAAAESNNPAENVAYASKTIIFRVITFYVLSIGIIVSLFPWDRLVPGISPFLMVLQKLNIPYASDIMAFTILIAILSCLNSSIYATSRTLFELAEFNDAPRWLIHTSKNGVPRRAIIIASSIGILISIMSALSPRIFFTYILSCAGSIILFVYLAIGLSEIKTRKQLIRINRQPTFRMWWFPYLSWITITAFVLIILTMFIQENTRRQITLSCLTLFTITVCRFIMTLYKKR